MKSISIAAAASFLCVASAMAGVLPDNGAASTSPTDATQMRLMPGSIGHQLIVPYYTAQNGNVTFLNLVNTDQVNGKAVKVRFRSGANSDDVFDFQLYLSPGDVWVATVSQGANGSALITSNDVSCTLPSYVGAGAGHSFLTTRLPQNLNAADLATHTREGHVEIITMADIPPMQPAADGSHAVMPNPLFTAIKHVNGVAPCTAAVLNTLVTDPQTAQAAYALGFRAPAASLLANWIILDIPRSAASSGEAMALVATRADGSAGRGNMVFFPQTASAAATPNLHTSDPSLRTVAGAGFGDVQNGAGAAYTGGSTPIIAALQFDLPDLSTPYLLLANYPPHYVDPVLQSNDISWSLATASIVNEYLANPALGAATDWLVSQPMRRFHAALDYRPAALGGSFAAVFVNSAYYSKLATPVESNRLCTNTASPVHYDREERRHTGLPDFPPPLASGPITRLCGATSILRFSSGTAQSVLSAQIAAAQVDTGALLDGWTTLSTPGPFGLGIPLLGKSFMRATNANAGPGISANFGLSFEHRYAPTRN